MLFFGFGFYKGNALGDEISPCNNLSDNREQNTPINLFFPFFNPLKNPINRDFMLQKLQRYDFIYIELQVELRICPDFVKLVQEV